MSVGKRIKDLDSQAIRSSGLSIPVDHSSFDEAKQVLISVLTPLISELTTQAIGNRLTDLLRFNDGAGNEYKTTISDIVPIINELSAGSISNRATDLLRFNNGAGVERKIAIEDVYKLIDDLSGVGSSISSNTKIRLFRNGDANETSTTMLSLAAYLFALAAFDTAVDARITAQRSTVSAQALVNTGTTYGYLSMQKFGNIVVGQVACDLNTTTPSTLLMDYAIPSAYSPSNCGASVNIGLTFNNLEGGDDNYLFIKRQGDNTSHIELLSTDISAGTNAIPFSWITD